MHFPVWRRIRYTKDGGIPFFSKFCKELAGCPTNDKRTWLMKGIKIILFAGVFIMTAGAAVAFTVAHKQQANAPLRFADGPGFAVVELFTSEGCSSCPPADELVARVQKEDKDLPVYVLAYHVDYWNRLGWKDIFSNGAYSDRQRQYANWLRLESVYTPQIVVNGKKEFVGSSESVLRSSIEKNLHTPAASTRISIGDLKVTGKQVEWAWQTEGAEKGLSLGVALVQRNAVTNVKAGENGGRTLSHVQIVRAFRSDEWNGKNSGAGHLDLPAGLKTGDAEVIAFLQNDGNGEIVAATRSTFQ